MQPQRGYKIFEDGQTGCSLRVERFKTNRVIVLDSQRRNALTKYIETYNASAPEDSINWGFDEAMRAVSSGQAATMLSYNWMLPTLNNPDGAAGDLAGRFALTEVPGGKSVLGASYSAIPADTEQKMCVDIYRMDNRSGTRSRTGVKRSRSDPHECNRRSGFTRRWFRRGLL